MARVDGGGDSDRDVSLLADIPGHRNRVRNASSASSRVKAQENGRQGVASASRCDYGDGSGRKTEKRVVKDRENEKGFCKSERFETGRLKARKRMLQPRTDNPLLRPIANANISPATSHSVAVVPETRGKITKARECRKAAVIASKEPEMPYSDEDGSDLESDGLSDFVVNDSYLSEEESSVIDESRPKSYKRLVRGRRPANTRSLDVEDRDLRMDKLSLEDNVSKNLNGDRAPASIHGREGIKSRVEEPAELATKSPRSTTKPKERGGIQEAPEDGSDVDDPAAMLRFSPSENKQRKVSKETRFVTPPPSPEPKPQRLMSPTKLPRIPSTPHRPSMDSFWSQSIVNEWNDEFSPRKTPKPLPKPQGNPNGVAAGGGSLLFSSKKDQVKQDRIARDSKKAFLENKQEVAESFLTELDNKITDGKLAELAASTGGVKIIWSKKLNTTAGRANWKRETLISSKLGPDGKCAPPLHRHHAGIELAEKVIDDENRLLNVIAHEFCHLANFMVSNIKTNPHGKEFKAWAAKCSCHFGDRGIEVTTKHSYAIDYKYVWECSNCGIEYKRHSKSIDPVQHRCGKCKSKLVQTKPKPRSGEGKINEYQAFVKDNMKKVREDNPNSPQKEIMGLVGRKYQLYKAARARNDQSSDTVSVHEEEPAEDDVTEFLARKLEFLDLTGH